VCLQSEHDAAELGVQRFIHFSAVQANPKSPSKILQTKGLGEEVVRAFHPSSTIIRSCPMFGEEDRFLNRLAYLITWFSALPVVNRGSNLVQPVFVSDVADAVLACILDPAAAGRTYELGGPKVLKFSELSELLSRQMIQISKSRNIPLPIAKLCCRLFDHLPVRFRFLSSDLFDQMTIPLVADLNRDRERVYTFKDLRITPSPLETTIPMVMLNYRGNRQHPDMPQAPEEFLNQLHGREPDPVRHPRDLRF